MGNSSLEAMSPSSSTWTKEYSHLCLKQKSTKLSSNWRLIILIWRMKVPWKTTWKSKYRWYPTGRSSYPILSSSTRSSRTSDHINQRRPWQHQPPLKKYFCGTIIRPSSLAHSNTTLSLGTSTSYRNPRRMTPPTPLTRYHTSHPIQGNIIQKKYCNQKNTWESQ